MADIHILRPHKLGLTQARVVAYRWAEQAEKKLQMECTYEEGVTSDEVCFSRAGAQGTLEITKDKFELNAKLGFLLGAFKGRIESEIVKNLDELLAQPATSPSKAHPTAPSAARTMPAKKAATSKIVKKPAK